MHETLKEIRNSLETLATAIDDNSTHNSSYGVQSGNWAFPCLSSMELSAYVNRIKTSIDTFGKDTLNELSKRLATYPSRIEFLTESTVPNLEANPQQAIPALLFTLNGLEQALEPNLKGDPNREAIKRVKNLNTRLRSREAQLNEIEPKFDDLDGKIALIENAHSAADQLPTDLEALQEARANINQIHTEVEANRKLIEDALTKANEVSESLRESDTNAQLVLTRCETAYSAATSVGLAAAFSDRSRTLGWSVWVWTALLIAALAIAGLLGFWRIQELAQTISDSTASDAKTALQFLLSLLSVGAPIWFAWLATRQIGQRFRIAEDYAFKASVSQAYEGYRREAARIDADMEQELLGSALARLDEQPLRLVEPETHSSPLTELTGSPVVKQALETIPNFAGKIRDFASSSLETARHGETHRKSPQKAPSEIPEDSEE